MERYRVMHIRRMSLAALLVAALGLGCAQPSAYKAPVAKFRDASAVVIESTKGYLIALNKTERDHYLFTKAAAREQIQLLEVEKVQVFSAEAIAIRLDALDQLADYTELLYRLATSDAPETVTGRARDLGTAMTNLSGEVSELTGADNKRFASAAGKVLPILGGDPQSLCRKATGRCAEAGDYDRHSTRERAHRGHQGGFRSCVRAQTSGAQPTARAGGGAVQHGVREGRESRWGGASETR